MEGTGVRLRMTYNGNFATTAQDNSLSVVFTAAISDGIVPVIDQIDWNATYMNVFTSGVLRSARMPIPLENDRAAVEAALARVPVPAKARMVRIVNTGELVTFWASEALLPELRANANVTVDNQPLELRFNADGRLAPMGNGESF